MGYLKKPAMILFDYGQTLIAEERFNGLAGTRAVLERCAKNPHCVTAEEIQAFAEVLQKEIGVYDVAERHTKPLEIHNYPFQKYLYEYMQVEIVCSPLELTTVFWEAAAPGKPTDGVENFLRRIRAAGIRSGIISNISFSGEALENRIGRLLPNHSFEFIIASSEYMFRKPSPRIFQIALKKANLSPDQVWHCGDHKEYDVEGAKNCGITPVWYKGALENETAETHDGVSINHWKELSEILDGLGS